MRENELASEAANTPLVVKRIDRAAIECSFQRYE